MKNRAKLFANRRLSVEKLENRHVFASELASLNLQFFAANIDGTAGANLDPNPNDNILQANIAVGQRFIVRTLARDLRAAPKGVFSVYTDLEYRNTDSQAGERIELEWGEQSILRVPALSTSGSFRLRFGSDVTSEISLVPLSSTHGFYDKNALREALVSSLERLPSIGVGNVKVGNRSENQTEAFDISFIRNRSRQDIIDPSIESNSVIDKNGVAQILEIIGTSGATASSPKSLLSAYNLRPVPSRAFHYSNGISATAEFSGSGTGAFRIKDSGGFANTSLIPANLVSTEVAIYDTYFTAKSAGSVSLRHRIASSPDLGVSLFGASQFLAESELILPAATIQIENRLLANSDSVTINEDAGATAIAVLNNDIDPKNGSLTVSSVAQPSVGGTVSIATDLKSVIFTPSIHFFGQATFNYVVINSLGDQATGTVVVNVLPINDAPTLNPIANLRTSYNSLSRLVQLSNVRSGPGESAAFTVTATSSNPSIVSSVGVENTSDASAPRLRLSLAGGVAGKATILVTVTDSEGLATQQSFDVQVDGVKGNASKQNPLKPLDVNQDGFISPLDALNIVNSLNSQGASFLSSQFTTPSVYPDVNGDDYISTLDFVAVVDSLNEEGSGSTSADLPLTPKGLPLVEFKCAVFSDTGTGPGVSLDPNPNDSISEGWVAKGASFYVQLQARDLGESTQGVFTSYSDLLYTNVDATLTERIRPAVVDAQNSVSSSLLSTLGSLKQGTFVNNHSNVPGQWILEEVGETQSQVSGQRSTQFRPVVNIRFQALELGTVNLQQAISGHLAGSVGISMFRGTGDYLSESEVVLPTAKIVVAEGLDAVDDTASGLEDQPVTIDVLANDLDLTRQSTIKIPSIPPSVGGTLVVQDRKILFTPPANYAGTTTFRYTLRDPQGREDEATVTVITEPVNDPPVVGEIADITIDEFFIAATSSFEINAGGQESQSLLVTLSSSDTSVVSAASFLEFLPGVGIVSLTPALGAIGQSRIELRAMDGGLDNDLATLVDNATMLRTFNVTVQEANRDFGDAPTAAQSGLLASYPTTKENNGAFHVGNELRLGSLRDSESNGIPEAGAKGDDNNNARDEEGILFPFTHPINDRVATISSYVALASDAGFIDAWIDFNRDGDWFDAGEQISVKTPVTSGRNIVPFTIPGLSLTGTIDLAFARYRFSRDGGLGPTGFGQEGEVEDHSVTLNRSFSQELEAYDQILGPHEVDVVDGSLIIRVGGKTVFQAPAENISVFRRKNLSGEVTFEMRNPGGNLPGRLSYSESTGKSSLMVAKAELSLTNNVSSLAGVSTISLTDTTAKSLSFQASDVLALNADKTLRVEMTNEDTLKTSSRWESASGRIENGKWVQLYEAFGSEATLEIVTDRPWRNEVKITDIDGNAITEALDVLLLVNAINKQQFGQTGTLPIRSPLQSQGFFDPNGDLNLGALDVLVVVNHINAGNVSLGEGEQATLVDPWMAYRQDMALMAMQDEDFQVQERRRRSRM